MSAVVDSCAQSLLGTHLSANVPLMSAGLDSMAATEFTNVLSDSLEVEISPVMLFDHPTLGSITSALTNEMPQSVKEEDSRAVDTLLHSRLKTCV